MKNYFYLFLLLSVLTSCEAEDNNPVQTNSGDYSNGFFVLNEGLFGEGNSTISFVAPSSNEMEHKIFHEVNGVDLGDTASDIGFYEDLAFIVVNVSNSIEVVDKNSFVSLATITSDLKNPRKIAFLNGMAYVTNWGEGSNPDDDFVAVFDTETFQLITTIPVEEGPEDILVEGERIFVSHQGGWNFNNKISVILGNAIEKIIEVGDVPNSLSAEGGSLWVSNAGYPDWFGETAGSISRIDLATLEVDKIFSNASASWHPTNLVVKNGTVYYTVGTEVFSFGVGEESLPSVALFNMPEVENFYGFKLHDAKVFATSASADFTGDGKLYVYDAATGNLQQTFDTGINPNGIFFTE